MQMSTAVSYDTRRQERLLGYSSPDLLVFPSTGITELQFCCSDAEEPMQHSLDALARDAQFALISQEKLAYKNIFTQQLNLDSVTS